MNYIIKKVPLFYRSAGRRPNPISQVMRKLKVGESFIVKIDDPHWTGSQIRNENMRRKGLFVSVRVAEGFRVGRVE